MSLKKFTRSGLTLVEILIALTMTLIVLGAMMYSFRYASHEISEGRAMMELSNQLRIAQDLLRDDFDGLTVDTRPWAKTSSPNGYLEIIEDLRVVSGGAVISNGSDDSTFVTKSDSNGDGTVNAADLPVQGVMGDIGDILAMTVRSHARPFRGRFNGQVIESNIAEVVWWTTYDDLDADGAIDFDEPISLHRRVLLIRPDLVSNVGVTVTAPITEGPLEADTPEEIQEFFLVNDVSARVVDLDGDGNYDTMIPNSLEDLSKRENRFARVGQHIGGAFPYAIQAGVDIGGVDASVDIGLGAFELSDDNMFKVDAATAGSRGGGDSTFARYPDLLTKSGDDVVISDVIAFDLRVYSPDSPINVLDVATEPGDVGMAVNAAAGTTYTVANPQAFGAFVDLAYLRDGAGIPLPYETTQPAFSTLPQTNTLGAGLDYNIGGTRFVVFDTFSTHYESDGLDTDGDGAIDEGIDGVDSDNVNGVDDNGEREVLPPYPNRLLGAKVTIRVVEPKTKQVRQTEVVSSFVPQ